MTKRLAAVMTGILLLAGAGCLGRKPQQDGVVKEVDADVSVGADGVTIEQRNVTERYKLDNKPGSIKHLYVISAWTGDVLIYSTVRGKVTSSGKRLQSLMRPQFSHSSGPVVERMADDGTYGSSVAYIYWWDTTGRYHQHYISGGQIVHISDQALKVGPVTLDVSLR